MSLQLRLEPSKWGRGCCGPTTCGAVGTVEESGRLTGLGLVPPDGPLVATGGREREQMTMGQLIRECLFCGPFSGGVAEDSLFHIPGLAQAEGGFQFRGLWGTA